MAETTKKTMWEDFIALQEELTNPQRTKDNPFYGSKYAPLDKELEYLRPLFVKNNFAITQTTEVIPISDVEINVLNIIGQSQIEENLKVELIKLALRPVFRIQTDLIHNSGGSITSKSPAARAEKDGAQAAGSMQTYFRRYGIEAICGIAGEEDDDGNAVESEKKPTAKKPTKQEGKQSVEDLRSEIWDWLIEMSGGEEAVAAGMLADYSAFPKKDQETGKPLVDEKGEPVMRFTTNVHDLKISWAQVVHRKVKDAYEKWVEEQVMAGLND